MQEQTAQIAEQPAELDNRGHSLKGERVTNAELRQRLQDAEAETKNLQQKISQINVELCVLRAQIRYDHTASRQDLVFLLRASFLRAHSRRVVDWRVVVSATKAVRGAGSETTNVLVNVPVL